MNYIKQFEKETGLSEGSCEYDPLTYGLKVEYIKWLEEKINNKKCCNKVKEEGTFGGFTICNKCKKPITNGECHVCDNDIIKYKISKGQ